MISVIIPSYNSESTIEKCLTALAGQSYTGQYEIILVDSSTDRTPEIVESGFPRIKYFHFDKKTDPGTARNKGLEMAAGEIMAFIDSDCIAERDWLENIVKAHEGEYRIVGGVVCNGNDPDSNVAWAGYLAEFREFLPEMPEREVDHIPTCNISYRRNIFDEYGTFQGRYYPQEDLVFNHALRRNGERILCDPSIRIHHNHRTGLKDFFDHQKRIGAVTSRVLKSLDLEGSFIARHRMMAILVSPLLPLVKFFRTIAVFMRYQPSTVFLRPLAVLIFFSGLLYWIGGFMQGVFDEPM